MTLIEMKEKVGTLQTKLEEIEARVNDGEATEEDLKNADIYMKEQDDLYGQIETVEKMSKRSEDVQGSVQASSFQVTQDEADIKHDSLGHFAMDVARHAIKHETPKLLKNHLVRMAATGMSEGQDSDGGFLVDPEHATGMIEKMHNTGVLISRVRKYRTASNIVTFKYLDEDSRADGSRLGGVLAYWEGEANQYTEKQPKFGKFTLQLKKLTGLSYVTDELLEDAPMLNSFLPDAFSQEFGFKLDEGIVNGTGAGQPLGIYNSDALISISKETGQGADTILFENLVKMFARFWNKSRGRGVVLANQDTIPQLYTMYLAAGTGGQAVFLPANGAAGRPYDSIFGMPILYIEQAQTIGDKGDIYLFDPNEYLFVDKGTMQSATSIHLRFDYSETAFRWVYRADGQPTWDSALTPYSGSSNTISPYVTLAARS